MKSQSSKFISLIFIIYSIFISFTHAETISATDAEIGDKFGYDIAASTNFLIIGAPGDDDQAVDSGAVYIYKQDVSGLYDLPSKKTITISPPVDGDEGFGATVAISDDYALVGSLNFFRVPFFTRDNNNVWTMTSIPRVSNYDYAKFGCAVSVYGNYAAIGAEYKYISGGTQGPGRVDLFTQNNGWAYSNSKGGDLMWDYFGAATAMSNEHLVISQPRRRAGDIDNAIYGAGQINIYTRSGDTWDSKLILNASSPVAYTSFGSSLSLSANYLAVGSDIGTYIFKRNENTWIQQTKVSGSGKVAISDNYLLSISTNENNKMLYVYQRVENTWRLLTTIPAPYEDSDYPSVAIAGDQFFLGLPSHNNNTGIVQTYNFNDYELQKGINISIISLLLF